MNEPLIQPKFTPTEQRMMLVLGDGQYHLIEELRRCLGDEMQPNIRVRVYVFKLRQKLHVINQDIATERRFWKTYLRLVRLYIPNDEE